MRLVLVVMALLVGTSAVAGAKRQPRHARHDAFGFIVLNGERTEVHWTDGDSFKVRAGQYKGKGTRLVGYNTLEAYGPVHSWGDWSPEELFAIAEGAAAVAAAKEWTCTTDGKEDGYHRLLVDCPDLAVEMARQGVGMAYAVDGAKCAAAVLDAQREAQGAKRGMWRKGVPKGVMSSVHSVGEDGGGGDTAYNRVVDTRTGEALKRAHQRTYGTCEKVCETTDGDPSCMVYVPFNQRYKNQPDCLR